ncbi:MAG: DUF4387 family protein [Bacillota bacterium]|nr:DUF4387 family protein [Bacillota bacterium]
MAKTVRRTEVAEVIRSKNPGPYELTFDPIFWGALGESDVYGAQQRAPLLDLELPLD